MKHIKYILVIFVLVLGVVGCEKYKLKQPTSLTLNWKMTNNSSDSEKVELLGGKFNSEIFSIEGKRVAGGDVTIEQQFPLSTLSFNKEQDLGLNIDVPVGNYTDFKLKLSSKTQDGFAVVINGVYHGTDDIPVRIDWSLDKILEFNNNNSFELEKDKKYKCILELDRNELFQDISIQQWQGATISMENGIPTIVLSKDYNSNIFIEINEKLSSALHLSIE